MRIIAALALAGVSLWAGPAAHAETMATGAPSHGLSAFGDLGYPPDFTHFNYVNPDAPRGGLIVVRPSKGPRTFDNFNPFITRGDAADGSEFLYDSLMVRAYDEPDAVYGLVAESAELADDRSFVVFNLRAEPRFADGSPLTAEDVAFSILTLRDEGRPTVSAALRGVADVTVETPRRLRVSFDPGAATRDLPLIVATLPIFSKAYFDGRDFQQPTRGEAPLTSGPYQLGPVRQGQSVTYERREDYWGWDLPVLRGQLNFDRIRFEYFQDSDIGFEAFTGGDIDFNEEFRSVTWATRYDFPAIQDGRVVKEVLPDGRIGGTQGFWINTRLEKFQDRRVREALGLAFDFEWSNERLFYGLYQRTDSFFEGSGQYQASGAPSEAELALLEPFRDSLPASVFQEPVFTPPVSNGSGSDRRLLRRARRLLEEAGWSVVDGKARNAEGEVLSIEFLEVGGGGFERIVRPYMANLERLGIESTLRSVDPAQFEARFREFDFDIVVRRLAQGETPGAGLRGFLDSSTADLPGSFNIAGVRSPAVDAMIDAIVAAENREDLAVAAHALDRIFRAEHYWIPNWTKATHTVAYWDRFGRPQDLGVSKPPYDRGVLRTWWVDAEKAAAIDPTR